MNLLCINSDKQYSQAIMLLRNLYSYEIHQTSRIFILYRTQFYQ